jgi:NAD(P)H-hydrate epimerase
MTELTALPRLAPRRPDAHKGDFGRVLIVAGSRGMSGAATLAGQAALRSGAGLVTVACPESIQAIVAAANPCYMTVVLPGDETGHLAGESHQKLQKLAESADILAIGPGMGRTDGVAMTVRNLLKNTAKTTIVDADALNVLAPLEPGMFRASMPVLTPHPGEFARLTGESTPINMEDRLEAAGRFAKRHRIILLLKGHRTIITDGERYAINKTGNPGMATGGSGDVLTGIIAALAGQGLTPLDAAILGAHLHGLAGDLAAARVGQVSLTALDLLSHLPAAFQVL